MSKSSATFTLTDLADRTYWGEPIGSAHRATPTEEVTWCSTCGYVGPPVPHPAEASALGPVLARAVRCGATAPTCPGVWTGATLPAPLDGPGAMADRRRSIAAALNGTGGTAKPDVTPGIMARGGWTTRTTARRIDGGKVTVYRLTVHGRRTLRLRTALAGRGTLDGTLAPMAWAQAPGHRPYSLRPTAPTYVPARDFSVVGKRNADGSVPKVVKRQRRSRAAILAATGRTDPRATPRPTRTPRPALTSI